MKHSDRIFNNKALSTYFYRTNPPALGKCLTDIINIGFIDTQSARFPSRPAVLVLADYYIPTGGNLVAGMATDTTVGRANGLDYFTRVYVDYGIEHASIETAILPYDKQRGPFSAEGDSGAIILDRAGRIVALLTNGAARPTGQT